MRILAALLLTVALALGLSACGDGDDAPEGAATATAPSAAFPVTIEHAFGSTTIPAPPKRVVALGWTDRDVVPALGIMPLAVESLFENATGIGPWLQEALGDAEPEVLDLSGGIPFERIAALEPDLILAIPSAVDDRAYASLARIAPTVPGPFGRPWREQTALIGRALGREAEARALVARTDARIAAAAREHPELAGTSFVFALGSPDGVAGYTADDPRVEILQGLGMEMSPATASRPADSPAFPAFRVSLENLDLLEADVLVFGFFGPDLREQAVFRNLDVVRRGGLVDATDPRIWNSLGAPTPLSVPYALDLLLPDLSRAAKT